MLAFFILTHMNMKMNVKPIGIIRNSVNETLYFDAQNVTSEIVVNPEYVRGLASIETFSHIIVLFWLDRIKSAGRKVLKVHPCRDFTLPLVGVFSSRSPRRPNPIAVTTVKLVERQSNVLIVTGLDAINGTPVLDIKPYLPEKINPTELRFPDWVNKPLPHST